MSYLGFSKTCIEFSDALVLEYGMDKFNHLPEQARLIFSLWVMSLIKQHANPFIKFCNEESINSNSTDIVFKTKYIKKDNTGKFIW